MDSLIFLSGLTKGYGSPERPVRVLNGVDLTLFSGESAAVTGPSGSGKTTLLNLIGALDIPDAGTIQVCGIDLVRATEKNRLCFRQKAVGFVFQNHRLLPQFTALENVLIPTVPLGIDATQKAVELLQKMGLENRIHHFPSELSGGEQQRTAIARALINNPNLLLADEPTGALDSLSAGELIECLITLNREGMTLLMVTHSDRAAKAMQRRFALEAGRILE